MVNRSDDTAVDKEDKDKIVNTTTVSYEDPAGAKYSHTNALIVGAAVHCPNCRSEYRERMHRRWWMRLLPGSRYYRCKDCHREYIKWWFIAYEIA